jgi:hypothetical protein
MKLFQQLLLAPAALGLLAPMAVSASELNLGAVDKYAGAQEQVTSITQFSDVQPTEWAYQALSNLVERYGCVAGYPDGTFRGKKPLSRWEAAALLNACLDRITEVTDELRRLMKEFESELAVLKGRVDGLEAKVGELEANQFSTTTKLKGQATFVIGANSFSGDSPRVDAARALQGATAFNYDLRLDFDTSFTGKDLLRTRLRAGNFGDGPWGGVPGRNPEVVGLNALEVAFEGGPGADVVMVNRLFYQFPVGSSFTATVGGRVRQDDMLAVWPSVYPADTVLDIFTYAGAPGAYSLNLGAGGGLWWKSGGFSVSANYVAANGNVGAPNDNLAVCGGIGNDCSQQTGTAQIAYTGTNFGLAVAYTYTNPNFAAGLYGGNGTPTAFLVSVLADSVNSFGVSGYWQPSNSGFIPSISAGWGINTSNLDISGLDDFQSQSWYVGLQWTDVLIKGNAAGMAVGQPTFLTKSGVDGINPNDGQFAWEWWYKFQVTDNISVTPAIFYLSAPLGQDILFAVNPENRPQLSNFGGLLKTTFKF